MEENLENFYDWTKGVYVISTHILLVRTQSHGLQGSLGYAGWLGAWEDEQTTLERLSCNCCHSELEEETHSSDCVCVYLCAVCKMPMLKEAFALGSSKALLC